MNGRRREQAELAQINKQPARLREEFATVRAADLLAHFRSRTRPKFFPAFDDLSTTARLQSEVFPEDTRELIAQANRIVDEHCWPVLGFGEKCFGEGQIQWNRDPLSGFEWPVDYHADINLYRGDGSDARVVWEVNRCAHFLTLGRAYAIRNDPKISGEFFRQLESWRDQNPVGYGVNWSCAMEVALRAMNLLGALSFFLHAPQMTETALKDFLRMIDQHGAHIRRNLEYSHIATSNHYLADVTGLLWIGLLVPELAAAQEWREFGLSELLNEIEKQVLPDGADYEASTGYHRLKTELWLYSFVLCHLNGVDIKQKYWDKLRSMVAYIRAYLRPDGLAPLVGDSDSGQVFPIKKRRGDDHSYLLSLGAAVFQEPAFKTGLRGSGVLAPPEEVLWLLGSQGVRDYEHLHASDEPGAKTFPDAGVCLLRENDLYLHFNAGGVGVNGRGSHGHNDALSIEVSAGGSPFIIDPGSYLYTADLHQRHLFRSTAYHSTVQVDGAEQNTIDQNVPFVIGNEAQPKIIKWESATAGDEVVGEHYGYRRLPAPVVHRRTVRFDKSRRLWTIRDELDGTGEHEFAFRFHLAPGRETRIVSEGMVEVSDPIAGARLLIKFIAPAGAGEPMLERGFASFDYGAKEASVSVCWTVRAPAPFRAEFVLIPVRAGEDLDTRISNLNFRSEI